MKKILSVFLVLIMLLTVLAGCKSSNSVQFPSTPTVPGTAAPTTPADPTDGTTAPEIIDREFVVNDAQLEFDLTDDDFDDFEEMLSAFETAAKTVTDADAIDQMYSDMEDKFDYLSAQASIATVLYYSDLTDEDASDRYLDTTESLTEAQDSYMQTMRQIYNGDYAAKDIIFADWTDVEIRELLAYTDEVMTIQQRNAEINVAYQDLQEDPAFSVKMVPLYTELVENNNRMAQIFGYDNYYEYAYKDGYARDYESDQIDTMRKYTAKYLLPAMEGALTQFVESYQELSSKEKRFFSSFTEDSYADMDEPYLENYFDLLPRSTRNTMLEMFDGNIVMVDDVPSAMEGAFTTDLGSDRTICFFGPNCSDTLTVVHEVGHYYACCYTELGDIPLDLAEVHSQGNEWLFTAFMEGKISEELYSAIVNYKVYMDLTTVVLGLMVDAFEEEVYKHNDPGSLSSSKLDAIMEDVCEQFGGIDYINEYITDPQYYWRMVVVEQPVYYVSYSVSAMAAIDLYTVAQEDFDKAVDSYVYLAEELDPDRGFLGNLEDAGLSNPFEKDAYKRLEELFA